MLFLCVGYATDRLDRLSVRPKISSPNIKYTLHWEYLLKYSKVIVDFDHYFIAGRRGCYHCGLSAKERP